MLNVKVDVMDRQREMYRVYRELRLRYGDNAPEVRLVYLDIVPNRRCIWTPAQLHQYFTVEEVLENNGEGEFLIVRHRKRPQYYLVHGIPIRQYHTGHLHIEYYIVESIKVY